MFRVTVPAAVINLNRVLIFGHQVINNVGKIADVVHKLGKGFGKRAAHLHFLVVYNINLICGQKRNGPDNAFLAGST